MRFCAGELCPCQLRAVDRDEVIIEAKPLAPLDASEAEALQTAVERYGRFIGMPAALLVS